MRPRQLYFDLPPRLIAQHPQYHPHRKRLLVLSRADQVIRHCRFSDLPSFLRPHDLLVFNDSAVIPARVWGLRESGGQVEVTLITRIGASRWQALIRPSQRPLAGERIFFAQTSLEARVTEQLRAEIFLVRFSGNEERVKSYLDAHAQVNAPFYLSRLLSVREYQTAFARFPGSTQCPTAGLHFRRPFLRGCLCRGIALGSVTLHIGGSILPLRVASYERFRVEKEFFRVSAALQKKISQARAHGGRVIAVGTSVLRALESASCGRGMVRAQSGWTGLTIKPPYASRVADGLLTNLHLPSSSHLLLTAAFAGTRPVVRAYRDAVRRRYKFLDFGDAMLMI